MTEMLALGIGVRVWDVIIKGGFGIFISSGTVFVKLVSTNADFHGLEGQGG